MHSIKFVLIIIEVLCKVSFGHGMIGFSFSPIWLEVNPALIPASEFSGQEGLSKIVCASACLAKLTTCVAFSLSNGCQLFNSTKGFYKVSGYSTVPKIKVWLNQDIPTQSTQHLMIVYDDGLMRDHSFDETQSPNKTFYPQITGPNPRFGFIDGNKFVFVLTDGSMKSVTKGTTVAQDYHPDKPVPNWAWTNDYVKGDGVQVGRKFWYVGYPALGDPERLYTWVWSMDTKSWSQGPGLDSGNAHYDMMVARVDDERGALCSGFSWQPDHVGADSRINIANLTDNTWVSLPFMPTYHRDGPCAVVDRNGGKTVLVIGGNVCYGCSPSNIGKTYDLSQGNTGVWEDLPESLNYPVPFTVGRMISLDGVAFMIGGYPGPFGIKYLDWDEGWIDYEDAPANTGTVFPVVIPYKNI